MSSPHPPASSKKPEYTPKLRIVGLQEFCALPNGTIFCEYYPNSDIQELGRRGEALKHGCGPDHDEYFGGEYNDFLYQHLLPRVDHAGAKIEFLDGGQRWGGQEPDAKFLVFSKEDVEQLVLFLTGIL